MRYLKKDTEKKRHCFVFASSTYISNIIHGNFWSSAIHMNKSSSTHKISFTEMILRGHWYYYTGLKKRIAVPCNEIDTANERVIKKPELFILSVNNSKNVRYMFLFSLGPCLIKYFVRMIPFNTTENIHIYSCCQSSLVIRSTWKVYSPTIVSYW